MAKRATSKAAPQVNEVENQIVRANVNRQMISAENYVSLYVNDTQVQVSPWDIRLILGVITSIVTAENPNVVVTQLGDIRMSPAHAKKVAQVLAQQVANYEKTVGPIALPE